MTAKRKLIRRNAHKMIAKIFEDSTTAKVYTLNNGFVGESVGVEWVKEHTANISHAEHYDNLDGTYTIRIHSNLWYELASEKGGAKCKDCGASDWDDLTPINTVPEYVCSSCYEAHDEKVMQ